MAPVGLGPQRMTSVQGDSVDNALRCVTDASPQQTVRKGPSSLWLCKGSVQRMCEPGHQDLGTSSRRDPQPWEAERVRG